MSYFDPKRNEIVDRVLKESDITRCSHAGLITLLEQKGTTALRYARFLERHGRAQNEVEKAAELAALLLRTSFELTQLLSRGS